MSLRLIPAVCDSPSMPAFAVRSVKADDQLLSGRLWAGIDDIYASILAHPFIAGLTDGSLEREAFRFYLVQDATTCASTPRR